MSARRFRPQRRFRSELFPLGTIVCLALAISALFPRETFTFVPRGPRACAAATDVPSGCAFVTLTPAQENAALAAARTSWQTGSRADRRMIEMLPGELPETAPAPAIDLASRTPAPPDLTVAPDVRLLPPTAAAARPVRLPKIAGSAPAAAFPRAEMLRIGGAFR